MSLTIDLHQHVIPEFYWEASNEDGNAAGGINPPRWSLEGAIAYLDEAGIDVAVPSISTPGVHFGDDAAASALARRVNEFLANRRAERVEARVIVSRWLDTMKPTFSRFAVNWRAGRAAAGGERQ